MAYDAGLAERIRSILAGRSGFSERKMFGGIAFLIHGNMCCGATRTDLMVRLPPDQVTAALLRPHTRPMDFTGRPMKSMVFVDAHGSDSDEALQQWVEAGFVYARTLPPK